MRSLLAILLLSSSLLAADAHAPAVAPSVTADEALAKLTEGNKRFVAGESTFPRTGQDRRCDTFAGGQHPYATILTCADSRVPPEFLFDAGIGDLFVIRVAGNVSDIDEIATIEYGACHLNTPLIVVMGHAKCGAVTAVVENAPLHGNLAGLLDNIKPAADEARKQNPTATGAPLIVKAIRQNVYQSMQDLITNSPDLRTLMKDKKVQVIGAIYDIHGGTVEFLGQHPRESELLIAVASSTPAPASHDTPAKPTDAHHADPHAPAVPADPHGAHDAHGQAPSHDSDEHADATVKTGLANKYGAISAFIVGSLALSAVAIHLIRK